MKIQIKDKEFNLEYNNKALFRIEKETGMSVIELFQNEKELNKLTSVFVIVWAGIKENITFDEFSELAMITDLVDMIPTITEAIEKSFETGAKKK
jgi:hypothetical protein